MKVYAYTTGTLGTVQSTINYGYNNSSFHDQWTSYNGGTAMVYVAIGNPTVYNNGSAYTFTWTDGRRLASGTKGTASFAYAYNADGLRTKKTVNGVDYDYYWNGTRLEAMTVTQGQNTEKLLFYYDADGAPYALKYYDRAACLWRTFLYVTNLQGDVVALIDAGSGSAAATYEYDAWGRLVSESISPLPAHALLQYNPLTYRGYIYDEETGFYYLQTRYYDPAIRRFINTDGQLNGGFLGNNLYAYCENNPVNWIDPSGQSISVLIGIAIGIICGIGLTVYADYCDDGKIVNGSVGVGSYIGNALVGGVIGGLTAYVAPLSLSFTIPGKALLAAEGAAGGAAAGATAIAVSGKVIAGVVIVAAAGAVVEQVVTNSRSSNGVCFIAGTPVAAENGNVPIETIRSGDYVWAWNEETGEVALKQVVETYINETDELIHLTINGEEIVTTPTHPFYVPQKGWTRAVQLRAGDILVLLNGEFAVLEQVQHELLESPIQVYNFQVEGFHTYYVGGTGVLVHNSCAHKSSLWRTIRQNYWKQQAKLGGDSTWYDPSPKNLARMAEGKAPIGWDGERVVLHHVNGISNDMYNIVEIGAKAHRAFHGLYGYSGFIDIFLI